MALFWACVARGIHVVPDRFQLQRRNWSSRIRTDCGARFTADAAVLEELRERASRASGARIFRSRRLRRTTSWKSSTRRAQPENRTESFTGIATSAPIWNRFNAKSRSTGAGPLPFSRFEFSNCFHSATCLDNHGIVRSAFLEGPLHSRARSGPPAIVRLVHDNRISVVVSVPRILESMRNEIVRHAPESCSSAAVRFARHRPEWLSAGGAIAKFIRDSDGSSGPSLPAARESIPNWKSSGDSLGYAVIQGYGLTEASPVVAVNHPFSSKQGSLGKPVPGQEVRIAADGEILVRGESVAGAVDAEGWLHTGDLGEMDSEGRLYFRGRRKDVIVTPEGLNVSPDDVEAELRRIPEIKDSAVVSIGDQVHAALILRNPGASRRGN